MQVRSKLGKFVFSRILAGFVNMLMLFSASPLLGAGVDIRQEAWESAHLPFLQNAIQATGMFVRRSDVAKLPATDLSEPARCKLIGRSLESRYSLCSGERFGTQPAPGYCTGVLVGSDILVTAGHCMRSTTDCNNTAIVFDFLMGKEKDTRDMTVPATSVFVCTELLARANDPQTGIDFAVIRLNRWAEGRMPMEMRRVGEVQGDAKLATLGYQSGLPLKVSLPGHVIHNDQIYYFTANLNTTDGSSGSPVIDLDTGLLEGIVVRGQSAYVWNTSCFNTQICNSPECRGEDVTRSSFFAQQVGQFINHP